MKHLIDIADLSRDEIVGLMDEADRFREALDGREIKKLPTLRGRTVMTLFYENSTRTRSSFETAGKWMSADVINISASSSSVKKGESLRDTGLTLKALGADAIIIRHPLSGAPRHLAEVVAPGGKGPSVINAGDGRHQHPTQALLDAVTMRSRIGDVAGKKVVICGDCLHSRVVRSNVDLLSTLGAEVVLVAPPTLLPVGVAAWPCQVTYSLDEALDAGPDAVMMLRVQAERMGGAFFPSAGEYTRTWGLTDDRFARLTAGRGALLDEPVVMHPGPMLRGMEMDYVVPDQDKSTVLQQVTTGVHARRRSRGDQTETSQPSRTSNVEAPMPMRSPSCRCVCSTRRPLTKVPLREPRSRRRRPSPSAVMTT